jgi:hypothetical protein
VTLNTPPKHSTQIRFRLDGSDNLVDWTPVGSPSFTNFGTRNLLDFELYKFNMPAERGRRVRTRIPIPCVCFTVRIGEEGQTGTHQNPNPWIQILVCRPSRVSKQGSRFWYADRQVSASRDPDSGMPTVKGQQVVHAGSTSHVQHEVNPTTRTQ